MKIIENVIGASAFPVCNVYLYALRMHGESML